MLQKPAAHFAATVFAVVTLIIVSLTHSAQQDSASLTFGNDGLATHKVITGAGQSFHVFINPVTETTRLTVLEDIVPDGFGISVAMDNDTIVVGGSLDAVYVFMKPPGGWADMTQTARLRAK